MKQLLTWSIIIICGSILSAFAQNKAVSNNQSRVSEYAGDAWARIILDKKFAPVWADAERTYKVMRSFDQLPSGGDRELLGFEDMIKNALKEPLTREVVEAQFGKPKQSIEEGNDVWLDYGPIQFNTAKGGKEIRSFRAQRAFYKYGFVEVANNSLKKQDENTSDRK